MHKLTRTKLRAYIPMRLEVRDQLERIERMRSVEGLQAMRLGTVAGQASGSADRLEDAIIHRLDYQDQITPEITAVMQALEQIREGIDRLTDPMERRILRLRYLDIKEGRRLRWREIACILYGADDEKCVRAAQRLHGRAVENIPEG